MGTLLLKNSFMENCNIELPVFDKEGKDTGRKVVLDSDVFGVVPNDHVIYLDVKNFLANQRQGTHKAKTRSEVNYSTKKLGRQKGGGGARHGDRNANIFVGGGRTFGPVPRDYGFKLNKKVKQLACKSSLSYKAIEGKITIVEDFEFESLKTKNYVSLLSHFNLDNSKSILVLDKFDKNIILSCRNLQKASVKTVSLLNTYEILNSDYLLFTEKGLKEIVERFS